MKQTEDFIEQKIEEIRKWIISLPPKEGYDAFCKLQDIGEQMSHSGNKWDELCRYLMVSYAQEVYEHFLGVVWHPKKREFFKPERWDDICFWATEMIEWQEKGLDYWEQFADDENHPLKEGE